MNRPPLDVYGGHATSGAELSIARQVIDRSGVIDALQPLLDADVGRPRHLSLLAMLVAFQVNALHRHHQGHLVQAARVLNALTDEQRQSLGIVRWDPEEAYPRLEWLFAKLCRILESADNGFDADWFANRLARAAIANEFLLSTSVAVDGTDVETWGRLHGATFTVELDGEAAETQIIDEEGTDAVPSLITTKNDKMTVKTAKVFGLGDDGRKRYTKDPDARAGHRSATGSRKGGPYVGYELHLAVQTRDVRWTNYIDRTTLGPETPNVITTCSLAPAGTHRGKAIVGALLAAKNEHHDINDVVWDPGYSLCQPETTGHLLTRAGIEQTMQLVTHQRGIRPFAGDALLLDGQLFSPLLPPELRDLASPPRFVTAPARRTFEGRFNQRARWRFVRHGRPDHDGVSRWRCPFCAGLLRSRRFPTTMRRSRQAPLIDVPEQVDCCCKGTFSAPPAELPLTQRIPFGTTAWRTSMDRRQVVESANAAIKGSFCDLSRGFFRVFGRIKMTVLLGFTVAAYNLDRIRSFKAKQAALKEQPVTRAKHRLGTWRDLVSEPEESVPARSTGPPG
jgi:hypothetical protein